MLIKIVSAVLFFLVLVCGHVASVSGQPVSDEMMAVKDVASTNPIFEGVSNSACTTLLVPQSSKTPVLGKQHAIHNTPGVEAAERELASEDPPNGLPTNKLRVHAHVEYHFAGCKPNVSGLNTKQTIGVSPNRHPDVVWRNGENNTQPAQVSTTPIAPIISIFIMIFFGITTLHYTSERFRDHMSIFMHHLGVMLFAFRNLHYQASRYFREAVSGCSEFVNWISVNISRRRQRVGSKLAYCLGGIGEKITHLIKRGSQDIGSRDEELSAMPTSFPGLHDEQPMLPAGVVSNTSDLGGSPDRYGAQPHDGTNSSAVADIFEQLTLESEDEIENDLVVVSSLNDAMPTIAAQVPEMGDHGTTFGDIHSELTDKTGANGEVDEVYGVENDNRVG